METSRCKMVGTGIDSRIVLLKLTIAYIAGYHTMAGGWRVHTEETRITGKYEYH